MQTPWTPLQSQFHKEGNTLKSNSYQDTEIQVTTMQSKQLYVWQSLVESKHYSVVYYYTLNRCVKTSIKGGADIHWVEASHIDASTLHMRPLPSTEV